MDTQELQSKIRNLPVWAQKHIAALERQREAAQSNLDDYMNSSNEVSLFYTRDPLASGDGRRYIKAEAIYCDYNGMRLEIQPNHYVPNGRIKLFINTLKSHEDVALIPSASNLVEITLVKKQ